MFKKTALGIIDPQRCFMDYKRSPLPVPGALQDIKRLRKFISRLMQDINYIFVSYDDHPFDHISHANRWVNAEGNHPEPFTIITLEDYECGIWRAADVKDWWWQGEYLRRLNRPHCIWPVHGQENEWESFIHSGLLTTLSFYHDLQKPCDYYGKGMHRDTEQFGLFGADVPFPGAAETEINQKLIDKLNGFDRVIFAGEASSHCVMDSVNQFLANVPTTDWSKVVLLEDCMSPVPSFESVADDWLADMRAKGIQVTSSTELVL